MTGNTPPNWFPDPFRRYDFRFWDGWRWTPYVSTRGQRFTDPPVVASAPPATVPPAPPVQQPPPPPLVSSPPPVVVPPPPPIHYPVPPPVASSPAPVQHSAGGSKKVRRQITRAGVAIEGQVGGGTLFTEPVLVVNQKVKLIEVNAEYAVYNQRGHQIGAVREIGRSLVRNAVSVVPTSSGKKTLQIVDQRGQVLMTLIRPAKLAKSRVIVRRANGVEIGQIVQTTLGVIGRVRFDLVGGGQTLGSLNADSWAVWDFNIQDLAGVEVARITRGGTGRGRPTSTKRDKYVVEIYQELADPLRALVIASALAIDTALRQHHR